MLVAMAIVFVTGASLARYHHALGLFLNAGQATGCGGG